MAAHHARRTHCPAGHAYDEKNTYRNNGRRICKACARVRHRERKLADPEGFAKARLKAVRKWQKENPGSVSQIEERRKLRKYGMSVDDYNRLLAEQGGRCAICKRVALPSGRKLAVDHDHSTGVVRGLLCGNCNIALGMFRDDLSNLAAAIDYLLTKTVTLT